MFGYNNVRIKVHKIAQEVSKISNDSSMTIFKLDYIRGYFWFIAMYFINKISKMQKRR